MTENEEILSLSCSWCVSVYRCTITLHMYFPYMKNIPMSMTLCFTVGWRACQWFQKRSCISGLLSFSNTAITTVWRGERKVTEKETIRYNCPAEYDSLHPPTLPRKTNSHLKATTFHSSLKSPFLLTLSSVVCSELVCVWEYSYPLIRLTKKRFVTCVFKTLPHLPTLLVHSPFFPTINMPD